LGCFCFTWVTGIEARVNHPKSKAFLDG
jgi:hypothetical protein